MPTENKKDGFLKKIIHINILEKGVQHQTLSQMIVFVNGKVSSFSLKFQYQKISYLYLNKLL